MHKAIRPATTSATGDGWEDLPRCERKPPSTPTDMVTASCRTESKPCNRRSRVDRKGLWEDEVPIRFECVSLSPSSGFSVAIIWFVLSQEYHSVQVCCLSTTSDGLL